MSQKQKSRLLSLLLRHRPETFDLTLDSEGWVGVTELLAALERQQRSMSLTELKSLVANCRKQRFTISQDGSKIRAAQGHSVDVDLQLEAKIPPKVLFHGTVAKFLDGIFEQGLKPQTRQFVHLSTDIETATQVGKRRGVAVVLRIETTEMTQKGHTFYLSENGVWLTKHVPPEYLSLAHKP